MKKKEYHIKYDKQVKQNKGVITSTKNDIEKRNYKPTMSITKNYRRKHKFE